MKSVPRPLYGSTAVSIIFTIETHLLGMKENGYHGRHAHEEQKQLLCLYLAVRPVHRGCGQLG